MLIEFGVGTKSSVLVTDKQCALDTTSFSLAPCALYLIFVFACYNDDSFVTVSILIERFHDSR